MTLIETRGPQMFPVLDPAQIETTRRFASGEVRKFAPGELIYEVGSRHTPSWLVLEGAVDVVSRDGKLLAVASIYRDVDSLKEEWAMERRAT